MGLRFWDLIRPKNGKVVTREVTTQELLDAAQEYRIRDLCFQVCVNMVASAIGRCEFRTFRDNREIFERDYYLFNYEPNVNENSTMFLHRLVAKLYAENEALIISTRRRDGYDALVVADAWERPLRYPARQNEYRGVTVGEVSYDKTFRENEVLHIQLNHDNARTVVDALYRSYYQLIDAAVRHYAWQHGKHWKVHISQMAQGEDDFEEKLAQLIARQVKPFFNASSAVLPEFEGYKFEDVGTAAADANTRDIRQMVEDIFDFTARGFLIPAVLVKGSVEGTESANTRFLTNCIDPICDQLQEEITRKRYGYDQWQKGNFLRVDSSSIIHFDMFANAAGVEKLVGSGAYTINDVLRAGNQPTIDEAWARRHWLTKNIGEIGQAAAQIDQEGGKT